MFCQNHQQRQREVEISEKEKRLAYRRTLRFLRVTSDPFSIPESEFKRNYRFALLHSNRFIFPCGLYVLLIIYFFRLSKKLTWFLYSLIKDKISKSRSIPKVMKLLICLHYIWDQAHICMLLDKITYIRYLNHQFQDL